jgi:uncharacterized protein YpmB
MKKSWVIGISILILALVVVGIYFYNAQKSSIATSNTGSNAAAADNSAISSEVASLSEELGNIDINESTDALVPLTAADLTTD